MLVSRTLERVALFTHFPFIFFERPFNNSAQPLIERPGDWRPAICALSEFIRRRVFFGCSERRSDRIECGGGVSYHHVMGLSAVCSSCVCVLCVLQDHQRRLGSLLTSKRRRRRRKKNTLKKSPHAQQNRREKSAGCRRRSLTPTRHRRVL